MTVNHTGHGAARGHGVAIGGFIAVGRAQELAVIAVVCGSLSRYIKAHLDFVVVNNRSDRHAVKVADRAGYAIVHDVHSVGASAG